MHGKGSKMKEYLLSIVLLLCGNTSLGTDDYCHSDDIHCLMSGVFGFGDLFWDMCETTGVLRRIGAISLLDCVTECLLTTNCFSINYRHQWHLCDLTKRKTWNVDEKPFLPIQNKCIHSFINTWSKVVKMSLAKECYNHNCKVGQTCHYTQKKGVHCHIAYCPDEPNKGLIKEKFGLYGNIGSGVYCECPDNHIMTGMPFVVCNNKGLGYGEWDAIFSCRQANCPIESGYMFDEDFSVCFTMYAVESNYNKSKQICILDNGEIMKVDTWKKQALVENYLKNRSVGESKYILIQGERQLRNGIGSWRYDNGTEISFFNWAPNQPTEAAQHICLATADKLQWHACRMSEVVLCEILPTTPQ